MSYNVNKEHKKTTRKVSKNQLRAKAVAADKLAEPCPYNLSHHMLGKDIYFTGYGLKPDSYNGLHLTPHKLYTVFATVGRDKYMIYNNAGKSFVVIMGNLPLTWLLHKGEDLGTAND